MRHLIVGSFRGRFVDCPQDVRLELELRESSNDGESLALEGTLKALAPATSKPSGLLDSLVTGTVLDFGGGMVALDSQMPKPKPKSNPGAKGGMLGVWIGQAIDGPDPIMSYKDFKLGFIRDVEGRGWVGQIFTKHLACKWFALERTDGRPSAGMPPVNAAFAAAQARLSPAFVAEESPFMTASGLSPAKIDLITPDPNAPYDGANWLVMAARLGYPHAAAWLGRMYEFGLGVPRDPQAAQAWYAHAVPLQNVSAMEGLARLYTSGAGGQRNEREAQNLARVAQAARRGAKALCENRNVMSTTVAMIEAKAVSPSAANVVGSLFMAGMNKQVEHGSLAIQEVQPVGLLAKDQPFLCRITARRIDTKVTDTTPYRQWSVTEPSGNIYYYDNADTIESERQTARLITSLANVVPFTELVRIQRVGSQRYRLTLTSEGLLGMPGPSMTQDVDL